MPTPSSTEAIIAARRRISSCVPLCRPSRNGRLSGFARSSKTSFQAGFCFRTSSRRQHVRPRRIDRVAVEVLVALGQHVAAHAGEVDGAVLLLLHVGMHRLVREEQRERLVALARDELGRALVQQVGDVARARALPCRSRTAPGRRAAPGRGSSPSGRSPGAARRRCPCATCRCARSRSRGAAARGGSWRGGGSSPRARRCR